MLEEQQNTGKSASLAEKYANVLGQLSEESDGRAQAEHALEVECLTREEIIQAEVARQVAEERKRIEAEVEAKYVDKEKALDKRSQELDQRETEMTQKMDVLVQNIENLVNKRLAEVCSRAEKTALGRLAEMFETYLQAFMAVMDKGSGKGQELLEKCQIKKMNQDGLPAKAATVNDWHEETCELIEPLFELQKERVFSSALLAADGSPFPIINNEKHKTVGHYMIQYRSVETGIPIFLINTKGKCGRSKEDIMDNLKGWKGNGFMCDAYSGYDWLKKIEGIRLCRCAAHARRMSDRALKENAILAQINLLFYQDINMVEEIIKKENMTGADKVKFRKETAGPIWETFKLWAASTILDVPKDSLIYKALNYLLRNYDELTYYLDIPEMPLDNNDTERLIRDMVMGKKSYLFCRDLDACKRAAMMYSLFGACKVLGKNPERWLMYVLHHIKTTPKDKLYTLLPEFWEDNNEQKNKF